MSLIGASSTRGRDGSVDRSELLDIWVCMCIKDVVRGEESVDTYVVDF